MEKSLAFALPDRQGTLREAMRIFSQHGVSVLRVSYNRLVDVHALFVDVWGSTSAIANAENELRAWRFLPEQRPIGQVYLLELATDDDLSLLEPVLTHISRNELNVTYVDARTDGAHKTIQIAVYSESIKELINLLDDIKATCDVKLVPSSKRPPTLDNNYFMLSFAQHITSLLGLSDDDEQKILINSNRIMQNLVRNEEDPFRPFVSIRHIAETMAFYKNDSFVAASRITHLTTEKGLRITGIEPPVGSNTWVLECDDLLLCVDGGYCCYAEYLERMLKELYPNWDKTRKEHVLTHGDTDHIGACGMFDRIYASGNTIDGFSFETMGIATWREQNPLSFPYDCIGNVFSQHRTPDLAHMVCLGEPSPSALQQELFKRIDTLEVAPLTFEVWEGKGGHVRGETVFIERAHRICLSGDVFVNIHGQTKPQARFNALAPYLMTSVDSNPNLARQERKALFGLLGEGTWQVMGGHGGVYEWHA